MDRLAVHTLTIWLILYGLSPIGEFDPEDESWISEDLPYRIWTIPAEYNGCLDLEQAKNSLEEFLIVLKARQDFPNFGCKELATYEDSGYTILCISIYCVI